MLHAPRFLVGMVILLGLVGPVAGCRPALPEQEQAPLQQALTKAVTWAGQKERFLAVSAPQVTTALQTVCRTPPMESQSNLPHGGIPIELLNARAHACEWPLTCKPTTRDATVTGFSTSVMGEGVATAVLTIEDAGVRQAITLQLGKADDGTWKVSALPQCPDGLWLKSRP